MCGELEYHILQPCCIPDRCKLRRARHQTAVQRIGGGRKDKSAAAGRKRGNLLKPDVIDLQGEAGIAAVPIVSAAIALASMGRENRATMQQRPTACARIGKRTSFDDCHQMCAVDFLKRPV